MPLTIRRRQPASRLPRLLLLVALAIAFILLAGLIDGGKGVLPSALWTAPAWAHWWSAPWRMLANALPALMLAGLILALTRRAGLAFVVGMVLEVLIAVVNALKFKNLGAPLLPTDFLMLGQLDNGGGRLLAGYLPHSPWPWLGVVAFLVVIALLAWREPPLLRRRWIVRGPVALLLVAALASLIAGWSAWSTVYSSAGLGLRPWSPNATRAHTGIVSSLMLFRLKYQSEHDKPDVPEALALMKAKYPDVRRREKAIAAQNDGKQKPDIVIILSESMFDPTILNGYHGNVDFLPNLHRLARHGTSGWMHSPTFGGGTIRTGFEILTGMSLRSFPDIQFPWLQIHQKVIPNIIRLLKPMGYSAIAVHGHDPAFWNRISAFKALGFDKFISINDFPTDDRVLDGRYMSDKSFTDEMLRKLRTRGPPQFMFGISMEAHGPYDQPYGIDIKERNAIPVPRSITPEHRKPLQNYIYHIRHADEQLGRLVAALEKRKRRTIVLLFGDHLPAIVPAFQDAGFKNGKGFLVQKVPYIIFDTGHPDARPVRRTVAAWQLPGMVLERAGITDPGFYGLTDVVGPKLADLTRAPDAPRARPTPEQQKLEKGMYNVDRLYLAGKLEPLWARVKSEAPAQAATTQAPATAGTVDKSAPSRPATRKPAAQPAAAGSS